MTAKPWFKFYPRDWLTELKLKTVPREARSFWLDLLCLMHDSPRYGYLLIGEVKPTVDHLASILGDNPRTISRLLETLSQADIIKVKDGVYFSKRMVLDHEQDERNQQFGKMGGNPKLKPKVNPPKNGGNKARVRVSESEVRKRESSKSKTPTLQPSEPVAPAQGWEEFRSTFPRILKPAETERLYRRIVESGQAAPETLLEAARDYRSSRDGKEIDYTAGSLTWLSEQRWLEQSGGMVFMDEAEKDRRNAEQVCKMWARKELPRWVEGLGYGTEPGTPGCTIPPDIQAKYGFNGKIVHH